MSRRYHYTTCLSFGTDGEADYCEIDATISYIVRAGRAEPGRRTAKAAGLVKQDGAWRWM